MDQIQIAPEAVLAVLPNAISNFKIVFLKQIELKNFRNYTDINLSFEKGTILIIGNNGQGKTNLLESIYYLSSGKSHRSASQLDLINWDSDFFLVRAKVEDSNDKLIELQLGSDNNLKIRVDKVYQKRKTDFINIVPSVIFNPDDLNLVKGSPFYRRNYMDEILEKVIKGYSKHRNQYGKILNQRNSLLKSMSKDKKLLNSSTFDVWNEKLIKYGVSIIKYREKMLNSIRGKFFEIIDYFFKNSNAEIDYIPSWYRKVQKPIGNIENIKEEYESHLKNNIERDLKLRTTTIGPHRDDLFIRFGGKDVRTFGSQGQQRIATLCLKLCELFLLKEKLGKYPLFLLDDVLSELDLKRKKLLIKLLENKFQTFITTTNTSYIEGLDMDISKSYRVENGRVQEIKI